MASLLLGRFQSRFEPQGRCPAIDCGSVPNTVSRWPVHERAELHEVLERALRTLLPPYGAFPPATSPPPFERTRTPGQVAGPRTRLRSPRSPRPLPGGRPAATSRLLQALEDAVPDLSPGQCLLDALRLARIQLAKPRRLPFGVGHSRDVQVRSRLLDPRKNNRAFGPEAGLGALSSGQRGAGRGSQEALGGGAQRCRGWSSPEPGVRRG